MLNRSESEGAGQWAFMASIILALFLAACPEKSQGATIVYPLNSFVPGVPATNAMRVRSVGPIQSDGTYYYTGVYNQWFTGTTNGFYTNRLNGGNFEAFFQLPLGTRGVSNIILFQVPFNDTNTYTLMDCQISGGNFFVTRIVQVPETNNFDATQFSATTSGVSIKNGAIATNLQTTGPLSIDGGRIATDGSGNLSMSGGGYISLGNAGVLTTSTGNILDASGNFTGNSMTGTSLTLSGSISSDRASISSDGFGNLTAYGMYPENLTVGGPISSGGAVSFDGGNITSDGSGDLTVYSINSDVGLVHSDGTGDFSTQSLTVAGVANIGSTCAAQKVKLSSVTSTPLPSAVGAGNAIIWVSNGVLYATVSANGTTATTKQIAP